MERVALCLTGQLRSVQLAHENWRRGPLYRVLRTGQQDQAGTVDTYVVTSRSNSFEFSSAWLADTLSPRRVLVSSVGFDMLDVANESWTHRLLSGTRFQFNMAHQLLKDGVRPLRQRPFRRHMAARLGDGVRQVERRIEAERGCDLLDLAAQVLHSGEDSRGALQHSAVRRKTKKPLCLIESCD